MTSRTKNQQAATDISENVRLTTKQFYFKYKDRMVEAGLNPANINELERFRKKILTEKNQKP